MRSAVAAVLLLAACGQKEEGAGYDAFEKHVAGHRIGLDADRWIEMKNLSGEWERVGLIFGYTDDNDECAKQSPD